MKTLIAVAAVVGITTSSNVFADSIHSAIEKSHSNATPEFNVIVNESKSAPWTIQDYVEKFRNEVDAEAYFGYEEVPILDTEQTRIAPQDFAIYEETPTYEGKVLEVAEFAAFEEIGTSQE